MLAPALGGSCWAGACGSQWRMICAVTRRCGGSARQRHRRGRAQGVRRRQQRRPRRRLLRPSGRPPALPQGPCPRRGAGSRPQPHPEGAPLAHRHCPGNAAGAWDAASSNFLFRKRVLLCMQVERRKGKRRGGSITSIDSGGRFDALVLDQALVRVLEFEQQGGCPEDACRAAPVRIPPVTSVTSSSNGMMRLLLCDIVYYFCLTFEKYCFHCQKFLHPDVIKFQVMSGLGLHIEYVNLSLNLTAKMTLKLISRENREV